MPAFPAPAGSSSASGGSSTRRPTSAAPAGAASPTHFGRAALDLRRAGHKALAKVGTQIEGLRFNVAVAQLYEFTSALQAALAKPGEDGHGVGAARGGRACSP